MFFIVPVVDFSSAKFTGTEDDGKVEVTLFTTMPANIDIPITLMMTDQPSSPTSAAALSKANTKILLLEEFVF